MGGGDACERCHWGFRWSSLGHEALSWAGEAHANGTIGTFGGAPCSLCAKHCPGWGRRTRT
eukprot:8670523-Pyramimonas_sp.AAC.1